LAAKGAKQKSASKPKRRFGRYLLLLVVITPLLFQVRHLELTMPEIALPKFELNKSVGIEACL